MKHFRNKFKHRNLELKAVCCHSYIGAGFWRRKVGIASTCTSETNVTGGTVRGIHLLGTHVYHVIEAAVEPEYRTRDISWCRWQKLYVRTNLSVCKSQWLIIVRTSLQKILHAAPVEYSLFFYSWLYYLSEHVPTPRHFPTCCEGQKRSGLQNCPPEQYLYDAKDFNWWRNRLTTSLYSTCINAWRMY